MTVIDSGDRRRRLQIGDQRVDRRDGARAFLTKPVNPDALIDDIDRALRASSKV
jgi:FixJ family two-component response regulator